MAKQSTEKTLTGIDILKLSVEGREQGDHWLIDVVQEWSDGSKEELRLVRPMEMIMHRCAEYGIDQSDEDELAKMVILEAFIPPEFWKSEEFLFRARTIETARKAYLRELAKVSKLLKSSEKSKEVLRGLKQNFRVPPRQLAAASLGVVLARHRSGAQTLDPDVARALVNFERAIANPGSE